MQNFLSILVLCSITMSMAAFLLILFSPLLSKKYEAKWQYYAWLVIVIGFIIPFRPDFDVTFFEMDLSIVKSEDAWPIGVGNFLVEPGGRVSELLEVSTITIYSIVGYIWIVGMIVVIGYHVLRHLHFMRLINRWSEDVCDEQILTSLQVLKAEMRISEQVHLRRCSLIASPMVIGLVTPTILLPVTDFSKNELSFILMHELVHYKRKDLGYKSLVLLATAIHWFNPIVYVMTKSIALQCELSCDAEVMKNARKQTRRQYCETIIGVIRQKSSLKTALSTSFYGGKENMKKRILSIMDTRKKKNGIAVIFGMLVFCMAMFTVLDNGKAANFVKSNENVAYDQQVPREIFKGSTESKQVIKVNINAIPSGEGVSLGRYTVEKGDMITYDITSEGKGNLNISFMKTDKYDRDGGYMGNSGLTGNTQWQERDYPTIVPSLLAGTYYLFVSNYEGESLENIKGIVEIAVPADQ